MKPIQLHGLAMRYDERTIFENVDALLEGGDRVALIGANGAGKSSLLRIIAGRTAASAGGVHCFGARVAWLDHPSQEVGSWGEREWKALGSLLRGDSELLLLDEPTRHLDLGHRQELVRWIRRSRISAMLLVSHDLDFLNQVATVTWHLDGGGLRTFAGTPRAYLEQRQAEESAYRRQYQDQQLFIERLQQDVATTREQARSTERSTIDSTIRRKSKKVAKKAKAREHRLEQLIASEQYLAAPQDPHVLRFTWNHVVLSRGVVAKVEDGSLDYGQARLFEHLFLEIQAGDRLGIVGNNGGGKSSLVEALLGLNVSATLSGHWRQFQGSVGFMAQVLPGSETMTIWQYFQQKSALSEGLGRAWLKAYGFQDAQLPEPLGSVSHGERVKLEISALAAQGPSVLVLDEPEHHLDWPSLATIAHGLSQYPGTLIVISHIPTFLEEIGCRSYWQVAHQQVTPIGFDQISQIGQPNSRSKPSRS